MIYTCIKCGKHHEQWPALTFSFPNSYNYLTEKEQKKLRRSMVIFTLSVILNKQIDSFGRY